MKARWRFADPDMGEVSAIAARHDLPEIVARLLVARGVADSDVGSFINPTLKECFPDPFALQDMRECAEFLADAVEQGRNIAVFGDFDVDGATSSAVMCRFLRHFGIEAPVYIPDRLTEGYGPNAQAFKELKDKGAEIVVLCDCGSTAVEPVASAVGDGLEIVILDHHETEEVMPAARHLVNPKRGDCDSGLEALAAVGVTFLTCVAVNNVLRQRQYFTSNGVAEAPLKDMLDIVALGTVCDMVPLTGANRLFVRAGLQVMVNTSNPGISALMKVSGMSEPPDPYHLGFVLGPRINAGSRVHRSDLGSRLLVSDDDQEATDIAWMLEDANRKRKAIQAEMLKEAASMVEGTDHASLPAIVVSDEHWHAGLAGLVAGRLKETYGVPAAVITFAENQHGEMEGRGSCRSVPGVNVAAILMEARAAGLLVKGGGHAMAGGFTIRPDRIDEFSAFFSDHVARQAESDETSVETVIDGVMSLGGLRPGFVKTIAGSMGPFGVENPEPVFVFPNVRIVSADIVGDGHVRLLMCDWEGGARIKGIAFRAADTPMGPELLKKGRRQFHIAGNIKINNWQGREQVEINVIDAAYAPG